MQKTDFEIGVRLVGSEMCISDRGEPMPAAQFAMEGRRDTKKLRANKQALLEAWEKMGA